MRVIARVSLSMPEDALRESWATPARAHPMTSFPESSHARRHEPRIVLLELPATPTRHDPPPSLVVNSSMAFTCSPLKVFPSRASFSRVISIKRNPPPLAVRLLQALPFPT